MIETLESPKLVLALEPESAAIACDVHQKANPGESFMVLDTGGGTVDITMNRLTSASPLRLDEIVAKSSAASAAASAESTSTTPLLLYRCR